MQYHVRYSIGVGERANGVLNTPEERRATIARCREYASRFFGGGSSRVQDGFWWNGERLISEPVLIIETTQWYSDPSIFTGMARVFARLADQTAVHVSIHPTYAGLMYGDGTFDDQSDTPEFDAETALTYMENNTNA